MIEKEEVVTVISEANALTGFLLEALDENQGFVHNLGNLVGKYGDVITPLAEKLIGVSIEARKATFKEFKKLGLSDDQAVKMACGR